MPMHFVIGLLFCVFISSVSANDTPLQLFADAQKSNAFAYEYDFATPQTTGSRNGPNRLPIVDLKLSATTGVVPFTVLLNDSSFTNPYDSSIHGAIFAFVFNSSDGQRVSSRLYTGEGLLFTWQDNHRDRAYQQQPAFTYLEEGQYEISLFVHGNGSINEGVISETVTQTITVTNNAPVAIVNASVLQGKTPLKVLFDGTASHDPDQHDIGYTWRINGNRVDSSGSTLINTFNQAGTYHVTLEVTDSFLKSSNIAEVTIDVTGSTIITPIAQPDISTPNIEDQYTAIRTFTGHTAPILDVAFSPDGNMALSGSEDNTLKLWNVATGEAIHSLEAHTDNVHFVMFSPDGSMALSASYDFTLKLWDVVQGREIRTVTQGTVYSAAFSSDGRHIMSGTDKKDGLRLWEVSTGAEVTTPANYDDFGTPVVFSDNGHFVSFVDFSNFDAIFIRSTLLDVINNTANTRQNGGGMGPEPVLFSELLPFSKSELSAEGHEVSGGSYGVGIRKGDEYTRISSDPATTATLSPDGQFILASHAAYHTIGLYHVDEKKKMLTFPGHTNKINTVSFSSNGQLGLSGSDDHTLKLWAIPSMADMPPKQAPKAALTIEPTQPVAGQKITFDASVSTDFDGSIVSYEWHLPTHLDDNFSQHQETEMVTTHTYATAGNYTATLIVEDDDGLFGVTQQPFTVVQGNEPQPPPASSFTVTALNDTSPMTLRLDASSIPMDDKYQYYRWFITGKHDSRYLANSDKPIFETTLDMAGQYKISLYVSATSWDVYTYPRDLIFLPSQYIDVFLPNPHASEHFAIANTGHWPRIAGTAPKASFSAFPLVGAAPLTVTIDTFSSENLNRYEYISRGELLTYLWKVDGQSITAMPEKMMTTTFDTPGEHKVTLYVCDSKFACDSVSQLIKVTDPQSADTMPIPTDSPEDISQPDITNLPPTAQAQFSATEGLAPLTINLDGSGSRDPEGNGLRFLWESGDGQVSGKEQTTFTYTDNGQYEISFTVTDAAGLSDSVTQLITVKNDAAPIAQFTLTPDIGSAPLRVTLDANASSDDSHIASYAWESANGKKHIVNNGDNVIEWTFDQLGRYDITLTVTDDQGQTDSSVQTVNVVEADCAAQCLAGQPCVCFALPNNTRAKQDHYFNVGERLTLNLNVHATQHEPQPAMADLYVAIAFPDGQMLFVDELGHLSANPAPYHAEMPVDDATYTVLDLGVPACYGGVYVLYSALVAAGENPLDMQFASNLAADFVELEAACR